MSGYECLSCGALFSSPRPHSRFVTNLLYVPMDADGRVSAMPDTTRDPVLRVVCLAEYWALPLALPKAAERRNEMSGEELRNLLRDIPGEESPLLTREEFLDVLRELDDLRTRSYLYPIDSTKYYKYYWTGSTTRAVRVGDSQDRVEWLDAPSERG